MHLEKPVPVVSDQGMDDGLKPLSECAVSKDGPAKPLPVDSAIRRQNVVAEGLCHRPSRQPAGRHHVMDSRVSVMKRNAAIPDHRRGRGFAGRDPAGQADDKHHSRPPPDGATNNPCARRNPVISTSGRPRML